MLFSNTYIYTYIYIGANAWNGPAFRNKCPCRISRKNLKEDILGARKARRSVSTVPSLRTTRGREIVFAHHELVLL